jgi:hypothetical protein
MRTFQEIADDARDNDGSGYPSSGDFALVRIAELAEAMHQLEYNLAVQLTHINSKRVVLSPEMREICIEGWLNNLRAPRP